MFPRPT